ncbi:hypothetical protein F511_41820 [Dorcoceras hygrometricum]|uniref:Uncharacterized protein n=1 Tax=Dorcoceras hygrometricum TaxID=472368 RepID=A0A2Z7B522_9LAMI|nr:hypothetical protein F511_41820 [Dorcoceras hygrometricum]
MVAGIDGNLPEKLTGTADLTACEQISPSFKITKPKISSNKSVQGINYKNKTQIYEKCPPKKLKEIEDQICPLHQQITLEVGSRSSTSSRAFAVSGSASIN